MRKGFLVVSGCPRSGTSLCMDIQGKAHGYEVIMGEKFPQENRRKAKEEMLEKMEGEKPHLYRVRKYLMEKEFLNQSLREPKGNREKYKDMNPEGFWECAFSVQGIIYRPQFRKVLSEVRRGDFKVVKVVSQGLMMSDPIYIGKIIYMMRHPRAVAKSQERLTRGFNWTDDNGEVHNAFENMKIHTPEMYISVTCQAANWFLTNPRVPVLFINFEDLVSEPKEQVDKMSEFVGRGDYKSAYDVVQPKLNRSKHEDVPNSLWEDAEFVYEQFTAAAESINAGEGRRKANKHFREIVEYFQDPRRAFNREKSNWRCYRSKHMVNANMCRACYNDPVAAANFKRHSESTEGKVANPWQEEPCVWECGMDLDREEPYLTIEESIENNWWKDVPDAPAPPEAEPVTVEEQT